MKRIYKLDGKIITLSQLLSELEIILLYSGDSSKFEELGISFEDIEETEEE